ncbi:hypothetical protein [Nocardia sp. NPDC050710]|uniref:hypothetical protein n=1 Tax=Nocardia sp. NPDC050710 TaxID=3157220 RepID=UPI0033FDEF8B
MLARAQRRIGRRSALAAELAAEHVPRRAIVVLGQRLAELPPLPPRRPFGMSPIAPPSVSCSVGWASRDRAEDRQRLSIAPIGEAAP